jgi:phosphonatase-like hydrolase
VGPIELVVFDLAGTTVDDGGGTVLQCLVEAAREHGLPGTPDELNALMGMNKREVFALLATRRGEPAAAVERVAEESLATFVARMRAAYERHLAPMPGAEETFAFLRARGIKVATDTGFDAQIGGLIMERLRWPGRLIDLAVFSSDVPRGRPAPYMIFRAMERLDVGDVRRVMKIGDSPADLDEGSNAGCGEVIGVLSGAHTAATLGPCRHTRLLPSVANLPTLFSAEC